MRKVKVGEVGVDSGQVIVCDPCVLDQFVSDHFSSALDTSRITKAQAAGMFSYSAACVITLDAEMPAGQLRHGVVSSTYDGDGVFPVYAVFRGDGRFPVRLIIEFCPEGQDDGADPRWPEDELGHSFVEDTFDDSNE